jgi:hypothetical protein
VLPKLRDTIASDATLGDTALSAKALGDSTEAIDEKALNDKALDCYRHADHCARQADRQRDPKLREDFRYLERGWLKLARSLESAGRKEPLKRLSQ